MIYRPHTTTCAACGTPISVGTASCPECGAETVRHCNACGAVSGNRARFCSACGSHLSAAASGGEVFQGQAELRQMTVVFCDLVGSTPLTNRFETEDVGRALIAFMNRSSEAVRDQGGLIARYQGDGLMAYFGYPQARDDDAERAVRAGLAVVQIAQTIAIPGGPAFEARVGIATGRVLVGWALGEGAASETAATGIALNLAARLQAAAAPGTVVLAHATRQLIGNAFRVAELGRLELKGLPEPQRAWRALSERPAQSRFEALHPRMSLVPLVGREPEQRALSRAWKDACEGRGKAIVVSGEPGVGKSRLAYELLRTTMNEARGVVRCYCVERFQDTELHPIIGSLERDAAIAVNDSPEEKLRKLERLVARVTPADEAQAIVPSIAALLRIPFEQRFGPLEGSPERQRQLLMQSLQSLVVFMSRRQPVLIVMEDLHWADPTTVQLITQVVKELSTRAVMVLGTARGDVPAALAPHVEALELRRLTTESARSLVEQLITVRPLSSSVLSSVLARADGVPLFIEELAKSTPDWQGIDEQSQGRTAGKDQHDVPGSLRDLLMARLDRLGSGKELAQIGAVIGRQFPHDLLGKVWGGPDAELRRLLPSLVAGDVVEVHGAVPDATYGFRHALIHDEAYGSLLPSRRRELHLAVAAAIEAHHPETVADQPEVLAQHYKHGGQLQNAALYWRRAGSNAVRRFANVEAISHLTQALEAIRVGTQGDDGRAQELQLLVQIGQTQIAASGYASRETGDTFAQAYGMADGSADPALRVAISKGMAQHLLSRARYVDARRYAEELGQLSRSHADLPGKVDVHLVQGLTSLYSGRLSTASRELERGLKAFAEAGQREPGGAACASYLSRAYWLLGYPDRALEASTRALSIARTMHESGLVPALGMRAMLHIETGDLAAARESVAATIQHARERQHVYWAALARILEAWLISRHDPSAGTAALIGQHLQSYVENGTRLGLSWLLLLQADAHAFIGDYERALALIDCALRHASESGEGYYLAEVHRRRADIVRSWRPGASADEQAEEAYNVALRVARKQRARAWQLRAATSLARLLLQMGRHAHAREVLLPVYSSFSEGLRTSDVLQAAQVLRELPS